MRHETEPECNERDGKPNPPSVLPKMVIEQRCRDANRQSNTEPNRLSFDEKINVAVRIPRKRARAEKHDDADDEHREHREEKEVSALALHHSSALGSAGCQPA